MIIVLKADTEPDSLEVLRLIAQAETYPNVHTELHRIQGATRAVTEVYLLGVAQDQAELDGCSHLHQGAPVGLGCGVCRRSETLSESRRSETIEKCRHSATFRPCQRTGTSSR